MILKALKLSVKKVLLKSIKKFQIEIDIETQ